MAKSARKPMGKSASPQPAPRAGSPTLGVSEERFRALVEAVQDYAIFMLDPEGHVASWNAGAKRIKGYEEKEILGRHFSVFYPREAVERGWPQRELEIAGREGRFEDEGWRVRKDGSLLWANVVITALRDPGGKLVGFAKVTRDLTERRAHEEELRKSEERLRLLVEGVQDYALFMLDAQGRVASWNPGAQRIQGYDEKEILGQHLSRFYTPGDIRRGWPERQLAIASAEGRAEDTGWRARKDGAFFWASTILTALRGADGALKGFANVTRDMTERRHAERLAEEGRQMTEFLAMLGHELRNPLAPIRNAVAILQQTGTAEPTLQRARDIVERQVEHLGRLVDDLLDIGRITSGAIALRMEPLELKDLLTRAAEASRALTDARKQTLDLDLPQEPLPVEGDPTRLSQVVLNLLSNAAKYTPEGGHIALYAGRDAAQAVVRVRDDGRGIPADLLPRIFELFAQGERSLDRPEGGLGIGLTLVQRLVHMHGGTVEASSPGPGRGSEFVVRLPLSEAARPIAEAARQKAAPLPASRHRILVVDDNQDAAESMATLLELWGHEVRTANDGQAALRLVAELRPDVVFLDLGLPGLTGYDVAERIRRTTGPDGPLLVAVTGYGQDEDRERTRRAGFAIHLVKPALPQAVRQVLDVLESRAAIP